jgi:BA14K-like protein
MQSKLLARAAALAFGATALFATIAPAAAGYANPAYVNGDGYAYDWGYTPDPRDSYDPGYAADPDYAPGPGSAYAPGYDYGTAPGGDDAYCAQRFRSYDPTSGTYLGYDGLRHSCP